MMGADFLSNDEHFDMLVDNLPLQERKLFHTLRYNKFEPAFKGRNFVVYEMAAGKPRELDQITVTGYTVGLERGAECVLFSEDAEDSLIFSYTPVQLFHHPVMVYLPLYAKLRWAATEDDLRNDMGSLAFPIAIRTKTSNTNVRDVVYCDTGPNFAKQFGPKHRG